LAVVGGPTEAFSVLYYRGDELTGVQCVNRPLDFMAVRHALERDQTIPAQDALDVTVPLKQLVTAQGGAP
jgi:3-phenylpropionate/trans-cinnamate dioxygenase ferredoxin reductase subunit